ncbi:SRPBCC family protein [Amaricoccus macauensis]|uniref:SRPBCC family protein n=1 Tax=Amaricoccus macauensis TaxID=57001 RepID=UPI003C7EB549
MDQMTLDPRAEFLDPTSIQLRRTLPGPIERVWAYLTESDLRSKWLASGEMTLEVGAPFTFTWRNGTLTAPAGTPPEGMTGEHSMESRITELDPPRKLSFTWDVTGGVTFELEPDGDEVVLTVTHRRVERRSLLVGVSSGWHTHLDLLAVRLAGASPEPFWDGFRRNRADYEARIPQ